MASLFVALHSVGNKLLFLERTTGKHQARYRGHSSLKETRFNSDFKVLTKEFGGLEMLLGVVVRGRRGRK